MTFDPDRDARLDDMRDRADDHVLGELDRAHLLDVEPRDTPQRTIPPRPPTAGQQDIADRLAGRHDRALDAR